MTNDIYHAGDDARFAHPVFDREEDRLRPVEGGEPLPYHYIHGRFEEETGVKLSFYIPARENFAGRFYQYLSPFPGPDEELASLEPSGVDDKVAFCLAHGAGFVETNMGAKAMVTGPAEK